MHTLALQSQQRVDYSPGVLESRFPVGSSARTRSDRAIRARVSVTRCCSPPESSLGRWVSRSPRRSSARTAGASRSAVGSSAYGRREKSRYPARSGQRPGGTAGRRDRSDRARCRPVDQPRFCPEPVSEVAGPLMTRVPAPIAVRARSPIAGSSLSRAARSVSMSSPTTRMASLIASYPALVTRSGGASVGTIARTAARRAGSTQLGATAIPLDPTSACHSGRRRASTTTIGVAPSD